MAVQYYNFIRLGFNGFKAVQGASREVAQYLAHAIAGMDVFELVSDDFCIPAFAFRLRDPDACGFSVFDVSEALRAWGWIVPAYKMPPAIEDMAVLRIVVRNGFGRNLADDLLEDLELVIKRLEGRRHLTTEERTGFAH